MMAIVLTLYDFKGLYFKLRVEKGIITWVASPSARLTGARFSDVRDFLKDGGKLNAYIQCVNNINKKPERGSYA